METVNVTLNGALLLIVTSIAELVGRTVLSQLVIATHADVMDQLSTTASTVLKMLTAQLTDTAFVTKTGETLIPELPVVLTLDNVTTDAQAAVADQLTVTVHNVLNMQVEHHACVMPDGTEKPASTSMTNVILVVTDVQAQQTLTVSDVYQTQSVIVTEIVSASLASGLSNLVKQKINAQDLSTAILFAHTATKTSIKDVHVTDQDVDSVMNA